VTYRGRKRASRQQISADERSLDTRNVPQALIRAKKQYAGGRLTEAEVSYKQILGIQPREPEALHMMGLINHKLGNNARALRLIKKSLSIQPRNARTRNNLATILKNQGNLRGAIAEYRRTIKSNPSFADAYNNLGSALMGQGNATEAVKCYKIAISIRPRYTAAHNNLGNALRELSRLEEAASSYKQALAIDPGYANACFNLGSTYYDLGQYEKAAASYRNTLANAPNHNTARKQLGDVLYKLGDFKSAMDAYKAADSAHSSARILECLFTLGAYDRFYETLEQSRDSYRTNLRAAAISAFASQQLDRRDPHPFCRNPLDFVRRYQTVEGADQSDFLDDVTDHLCRMDAVWEPPGKTTKGGYQTRASLFDTPGDDLARLEQALKKQIGNYVSEFATEDCGFIQSFPKTLNLTGWFIRLVKGGHQTEHLHASGWLSGVFYLQAPKTTNPEEGAIELGLWGYDYPILQNDYPTQRYYPEKGNLLLFPSSLFHRTIPIHSDEDRLSIAFDLLPTGAL